MFRAIRNSRVAFCAAVAGCLWLNQGPSAQRYEALAAEVERSPDRHGALRAWLPFAFAYRRSADEELYFAIANAIRGAPFDRDLLLRKRGDTTEAFRRAPVADGHWHMPYAEVPFEYPALLLPFILLPAAISPSFEAFAPVFGALMAALVLASIKLAIAATTTRSAQGGVAEAAEGRARAWWWATALILAQGGLLVQRLDAVPTFFLALALWAAVRRRPRWIGLGIALAAAAKITPILVIVPLCLADREVWRSRAALAKVVQGLALGLAAGFLPMLLMSPAGFGDFLRYHGARGLQIESSYATALSIVKLLSGVPVAATLSFGSYNLDGGAARVLASASSFLLLAAIAATGAWYASSPRSRLRSATPLGQASVVASAGLSALLCIWFFGKVFSPQYLTWGIPFVIALGNRRITMSLILAMAVAQAYVRGFYDDVVGMRPLGVAALAMRTAILVAMAVLVIRSLAGRPGLPEAAREPS